MLWALLAYYFFGGFGGTTALGHFYNDQAKSLIKAEVKIRAAGITPRSSRKWLRKE